MKLASTGYSNPIHSFERTMAPDFASREFRDPGLRMSSETGLGSLRHTMPHLRPGIRMQGGGTIDPSSALAQIASLAQTGVSNRNLYNPDPAARRELMAGRRTMSEYSNPAFRAMPGSTMGFPYAAGGAAAEDDGAPDDASMPAPEELMEGDDQLSEPEQQEKQIVIEALLALEGCHPDPQRAIEAFVKAFGKPALAELQQMVAREPDQEEEEEEGEGGESPEEEQAETQLPADEAEEGDLNAAGGGLLSGPGSGQSDEIEGSTPSGRPVLLSDGEYVIDAPTVAALGDGSSDAGARRLDEMRRSIRKQAYGHEKQAKPMAAGGRSIVVEFGG